MECESFFVYNLSHHYPVQQSKIPFGTRWAVDVDETTRYEFHRSFLQQLSTAVRRTGGRSRVSTTSTT